MSYNTEKWLCIGLIIFLIWLILPGIKIHTGGDEKRAVSDNDNLIISASLIGNSNVTVEQGGAGISGDGETVTCPSCGYVIHTAQ